MLDRIKIEKRTKLFETLLDEALRCSCSFICLKVYMLSTKQITAVNTILVCADIGDRMRHQVRNQLTLHHTAAVSDQSTLGSFSIDDKEELSLQELNKSWCNSTARRACHRKATVAA